MNFVFPITPATSEPEFIPSLICNLMFDVSLKERTSSKSPRAKEIILAAPLLSLSSVRPVAAMYASPIVLIFSIPSRWARSSNIENILLSMVTTSSALSSPLIFVKPTMSVKRTVTFGYCFAMVLSGCAVSSFAISFGRMFKSRFSERFFSASSSFVRSFTVLSSFLFSSSTRMSFPSKSMMVVETMKRAESSARKTSKKTFVSGFKMLE